MPTVFIVSADPALRVAVRAELLENGIEALGFESLADADELLSGRAPADLLLLEAGASAEALHTLQERLRGTPLLVVASRTQAPQLPEPLAAVIFRPVRVGEIVARVKQLLQGEAA